MGYRLVIAVTILLCGCDKLSGEIGGSERIDKLEARVTALEGQLKQTHDDGTEQRRQMSACLGRADEAYWERVQKNGHRKAKPDENGDYTWLAPVAVWDQASKAKQNAIEECRVLYGRS